MTDEACSVFAWCQTDHPTNDNHTSAIDYISAANAGGQVGTWLVEFEGDRRNRLYAKLTTMDIHGGTSDPVLDAEMCEALAQQLEARARVIRAHEAAQAGRGER